MPQAGCKLLAKERPVADGRDQKELPIAPDDGTPADDRPVIFTAGTSNRSWPDFVEVLKAYDIQAVADVRSFPTSRLDHFRRAHMEEHLPRAGIQYHHLGLRLGGLRGGGYEAHVQTESFARGLEELEALARDWLTAIVCAERLPWKCHRRHIARQLAERGWRVIHIIERDRTWEPRD